MLIIKRGEGAEGSPVRQCLILSMVRALELSDMQKDQGQILPKHILTALNAVQLLHPVFTTWRDQWETISANITREHT